MENLKWLLTVITIATSLGGIKAFGMAQDGPSENVLVELFTSEGCSSCPPADELLSELRKSSNGKSKIITLSEHVDYWNYLGWQDPFSAPQYSKRQDDYARKFKDRSRYTPQMVVDGQHAFIGSDAGEAERSINEGSHVPKRALGLKATLNPGQKLISTTVTVPSDKRAGARDAKLNLSIAVVEDDVVSKVRRGENEGRSLRHDGIVRVLKKLSQIDSKNGEPVSIQGEVAVDPSWQTKNLRIVAFLQDAVDLAIVGVQQINLNAP